MINKKKIFKSLLIVLLLIIIITAIVQIVGTLARYETTTTTDRNVDVAFWIVDNDFESKRILLKDIYPRDINNPFEYSFTVSNYVDDKIAETDLEYDITLTTTTNIPLSYEVLKNGSVCARGGELYPTAPESNLHEDASGTIYRKINVGTTAAPFIMDTIDDSTKQKNKITDTFVVRVVFPKQYSANEQYADLMEYIKIDLSARQVIEE